VRTGIVGCASRGSGTAERPCGTGALTRTTGAGDEGRATSWGTTGLWRAGLGAATGGARAGVPRVGIATEPPTLFMGPSAAGMAGIVARSALADCAGRSIRTMSL
jgi:hypothetical protein